MGRQQKVIVFGLVIGLLVLPFNEWAVALDEGSQPKPAGIEQPKATLRGPEVKVKLAGGKKVQGCIIAVDEGVFRVAPRRGGPATQIESARVTRLGFGKATCPGSGESSALLAKQVVGRLNSVKRVRVRTTNGNEYRGAIQWLGDDSFTLLPRNGAEPVEIAYSDVRAAEEKAEEHGALKKVAIVGLVVLAVGVLALCAATGSDCNPGHVALRP